MKSLTQDRLEGTFVMEQLPHEVDDPRMHTQKVLHGRLLGGAFLDEPLEGLDHDHPAAYKLCGLNGLRNVPLAHQVEDGLLVGKVCMF